LRDRLLRALADAENTRRRAEDRLEDARKLSIADFARELLIVVDNLQRAIAVAENKEAASNQALLEGVQATLRLFIQTLRRFGVRRIEALSRKPSERRSKPSIPALPSRLSDQERSVSSNASAKKRRFASMKSVSSAARTPPILSTGNATACSPLM
jgi:hypothetical protein